MPPEIQVFERNTLTNGRWRGWWEKGAASPLAAATPRLPSGPWREGE
jgi:hypothetical protein